MRTLAHILGGLGFLASVFITEARADPPIPEARRANMQSANPAIALARTRGRLSTIIPQPRSIQDTEDNRDAINRRQSTSTSVSGVFRGTNIITTTPDCVIAINYASNAKNVNMTAVIGKANLTCITK